MRPASPRRVWGWDRRRHDRVLCCPRALGSVEICRCDQQAEIGWIDGRRLDTYQHFMGLRLRRLHSRDGQLQCAVGCHQRTQLTHGCGKFVRHVLTLTRCGYRLDPQRWRCSSSGDQNPGCGLPLKPPFAYTASRSRLSDESISIASKNAPGPAARRAVFDSLGRGGRWVVKEEVPRRALFQRVGTTEALPHRVSTESPPR